MVDLIISLAITKETEPATTNNSYWGRKEQPVEKIEPTFSVLDIKKF